MSVSVDNPPGFLPLCLDLLTLIQHICMTSSWGRGSVRTTKPADIKKGKLQIFEGAYFCFFKKGILGL